MEVLPEPVDPFIKTRDVGWCVRNPDGVKGRGEGKVGDNVDLNRERGHWVPF